MDDHRTRNAHLLAMADLLNGKPIEELLMEAEYYVLQRQPAEAIGIYAAVYKSMSGIPLDLDAQREIMERMQRGAEWYPQRHFGHNPDLGRTIFFSLRIEAPWMKRALELPLNVSYPDILRAFAPVPREHDQDARFNVFNDTIERMRTQVAEREKYTETIAQELLHKLRGWLKHQDPVRGVFPENIIGG